MRITIIILFVFINSININAQQEEKQDAQKKSFLEILKGEELESSISFLPIGIHTDDWAPFGVWWTSYNYKSIEFAAFNNSFEKLTLAVLYKREIQLMHKLSLIYGLGIMYGYGGRLQNTESIPFRNSFLFTGDINPIAGLLLDYRIAKKLSVQLNMSPAVFATGVRFIL